ncbi:hypothetical protein GGX14DRAFT_420122 [Mycena pura]|uniref:Uncharacterized protein n=1 Tax=Mycena pura TaxID=153505 RepID=A0AAD6YP02_9AGAR|nr:hypothetical protein GGX14DRAFT_420122 [Mycena pura]
MILPSPSDAIPTSGMIPDTYFQPIPDLIESSKKLPVSGYPSKLPSPVSPPRYQSLPRPSAPITYTFTPMPSNSMLLAPPPNISGSQKPYYITVSLNCFTPTSYITSVRKQIWDGELVGDFEMGASRSGNPGTLCLRGNEYPIPDLLESQFNVFRTTWKWKVKSFALDKVLYWDDFHGGGVLTCYSSQDRDSSNMLAKFTPRTSLRRKGQPSESPNLLVTSDGHVLFDDILMSALIIERMRTAPS